MRAVVLFGLVAILIGCDGSVDGAYDLGVTDVLWPGDDSAIVSDDGQRYDVDLVAAPDSVVVDDSWPDTYLHDLAEELWPDVFVDDHGLGEDDGHVPDSGSDIVIFDLPGDGELVCVPDCDDIECGTDGCGGSCGQCDDESVCILGVCVGQWCPDSCHPRVTVPAGEFWMGANKDDSQCPTNGEGWDARDSELPCHVVDVPEFEIDQFQVTVQAYRACVEDSVCTETGSFADLCAWDRDGMEQYPVNCVAWEQARTYCQWAGGRMCSEAEWEKAARGTDGRRYPWGGDWPNCTLAVMNYDGEEGCGTGGPWPVGSLPDGASPYGCMDMSGNIWEFVEDDWHEDYVGAPDDGRAWVDTPRAEKIVVRGGSYLYEGYLHSSVRVYLAVERADVQHGILCCY